MIILWLIVLTGMVLVLGGYALFNISWGAEQCASLRKDIRDLTSRLAELERWRQSELFEGGDGRGFWGYEPALDLPPLSTRLGLIQEAVGISFERTPPSSWVAKKGKKK